MTGQIVGVVRQGNVMVGSVRVNEGDGRGPVEYVATVPAFTPEGQPIAPADVKAALVAAWQLQRAARVAIQQDLSGQISGNVNL